MKAKITFIISFLFISVSLYATDNSFKRINGPMPFSPDSGDTGEYYYWIDNYEPGGPTYQWIDIEGTGTKVNGLSDDNNVGPFLIGFDFPFYEYYCNQFWVNSNGALSFTDASVYFPQESCTIPSSMPPNDLVIPLGADLTFESPDSGECYYYTNNIDTFVLSYLNVPAWNTGGITGSHTFQLLLTRQDSCIYFQYGKQQGYFYNNCDCAGIENMTGGVGLLVFYYTMPDSGYAVRIAPYDSTTKTREEKNKQKSSAVNNIAIYPNPFTDKVEISWTLGTGHSASGENPITNDQCPMTISIYDVSGRLVKNLALGIGHSASGTTVTWDGKDNAHKKLPGGVYFLKFRAWDYEETRKLMLIR